MSVSLLTFGCRLNAHESEGMEHYARLGQINDGAPTIIVNTCTVTAEAERQARQAIRRAHRQTPDAKIVVTGCASERDAARWEALPGVQRVVPNGEKLTPAMWGVRDGEKPSLPPSRHVRALLQIQQGCDHRCTFCIIPYGRGDASSIALEDIITRARALSEAGHHELVLTGVDLASWQQDGQSLGTLCRAILQAVPELAQLRLSSLDPILLDPEHGDRVLWDVLENEPRLAPHLHLSLQAGSDLILKRMKRRHSTAQVATILQHARALRPDIGVGADVIAGFPTETDALFHETKDFLTEQAIPFLHVFPYSERPGTPAARMPAVPRPIRQERAAQLRAVGEASRDAFLDRFIGREDTLLMESATTGHLPNFASVRLEENAQSTRGTLQKVRILHHTGGKLIARPLSSS
ncbi:MULTISPECIES: MiaB/RimO family radical SAM methylthiotransferase [unclassified Saccharibacter]|uniref:MiaB/RimO family radical SAM methylthiotransferase n=1 Tax=unclassified Saccharibacter TaxID=2648722 RepID=UPI00132B752E|nr:MULTISPECIES: MiaB/RimO family radical SAM methylthiotransferase [unclassified Saccharibacter]MXV36586.1 MiaB/RimO family radical SAM methylthiotransferase [Saccharibacter sp. EH611]MXV57748.1 MiaB/RimO family radical SAM methylthiotransferase [Saccharibacter sp. EH70]MXV64945.1 MiaB/RimO family radical SAM methylthiotransferase [Saccharibacter sp. EH60]